MENLWSGEEAAGLSDLDILVYQSRLIGADQSLVLWGGGCTSLKVTREDFRGRDIKVLLVKGSGSDMKSVQTGDFPALRMDDILPLFERPDMSEEVLDYLERCLFDPGSPAPPVEALLHAFLPQASIVQTHPDAILSLTNTKNAREAMNQVFGNDIVLVPYRIPGILLFKEAAQAGLKRPGARGLVLSNNGLVTWGATPEASYGANVELVARAEEYLSQRAAGKLVFGGLKTPAIEESQRRNAAAAVTPALRSFLSPSVNRALLRFDDSPDVLEFVGSRRVQELVGSSPNAPDHPPNMKGSPLLVEVRDPSYAGDLRRALEEGVRRYRNTYVERVNEYNLSGPEVRDAIPGIVLVPGLGMWVVGRDTRALNEVSDIYRHTISVIAGAAAIGGYTSLSAKDLFEAEYRLLEPRRLIPLSLERELSRRVALVTGAAGGIGKAISRRLALEGAHVVLADINLSGAVQAMNEINSELGEGRCIAVPLDVADKEQVADAFQQTTLAFGGLDILVSNAGVAPTGILEELSLDDWHKSLGGNVTGHLLVSQEAVRIMRAQGLGGSLIFIAASNIYMPETRLGAYSAAKAAEVQLARVLAMENGKYGIRSNVISPDAVFQDAIFWSQEMREQQALAHGVPVSELEDLYRRRNLLQAYVTPNDVAEAALYLAGDRSGKTTGCIITVDGGLPEAFPR